MTSKYKPPFHISTRIVHLIADISAQIERYSIRMEQSDGLLLRKINRIQTIRSSLAIEGNTLSEQMVTEILEGKNVIAPLREIQEVKNAIKTYDIFASLSPYKVKDLLKAHGSMMHALVNDAGEFRSGDVGVFSGKQAVHIAPPAPRVPYLIDELFSWLQHSDEHLLIKSCVFHYEFEFIHPFSDGNGRLGRLWQSLILNQLHPLFAHLPVETMVFQNQQNYYDAISQSTEATNSGIFIEFMLNEILSSLINRQGTELNTSGTVNDLVNDTVKQLLDNPKITLDELAVALNKSRRTVTRIIKGLRESGKIQRVGSDKTGHWMVNTDLVY